MKMKKYTASIAAIAIVMTFVSCGEKVEGSKAEKSRTETEASAVISASPTETSELSAAEESAEDSKTSVTGSETDPSSADENEWHVEFLSADVCKNIKNENGVKLWDDNSHDNMVYLTSYEGYHGSDEGMHRFHIANSEAVFWAYKQDDSYEDKAAFHFALSEADITFLKEYISESEINKTQLAEAYKPFPKDKLMPGKEISLEQYEDMYNTLPPVPLKSSLFANGFQSSEQYSYKTNPETGNDEPTYMTFVKADGKAYYAGDNFMGRISEDNAEAVLSNLCRDEIEAEAVVEEAEACEM